MDGVMMRRVLAALLPAAVLATSGASAAAAVRNADFVGTWKTSNGQPFTIKQENRRTGTCAGTTSLSKHGPYRLVACHVKGSRFSFTITYSGGYKSYNSGTLSGNQLKASFHDTNGTIGFYTARRTRH